MAPTEREAKLIKYIKEQTKGTDSLAALCDLWRSKDLKSRYVRNLKGEYTEQEIANAARKLIQKRSAR